MCAVHVYSVICSANLHLQLKFRNLASSGPTNNAPCLRCSISRVRNSLLGPPESIAPSLVPRSSINLTSILFNVKKEFMDNVSLALSQICFLLILK